ncbi:hypothetical protein C8R45DRAFT_1067266 [Mycena sanguinolenta]|nr:hypothetical protein C8R45DRAFT_1067266 [Mycena sanguinolenta]
MAPLFHFLPIQASDAANAAPVSLQAFNALTFSTNYAPLSSGIYSLGLNIPPARRVPAANTRSSIFTMQAAASATALPRPRGGAKMIDSLLWARGKARTGLGGAHTRVSSTDCQYLSHNEPDSIVVPQTPYTQAQTTVVPGSVRVDASTDSSPPDQVLLLLTVDPGRARDKWEDTAPKTTAVDQGRGRGIKSLFN